MNTVGPEVLIVEDEIVVAMDIAEILSSRINAKTHIATTFEQMREAFETFRPNLALLDINLRERHDGITAAEYIRRQAEIPIIFLTAYSDERTIDRALRVEPDGYIVKPFKEEDLVAAAKLHFYKWRERQTTLVRLDDEFIFNLANDELLRNGEPVPLTKKERLFLRILVERRNGVVSIETIDHAVWPEDVVNNNARRNIVYRIRKKLDDRFLKTVYGLGYKLEL